MIGTEDGAGRSGRWRRGSALAGLLVALVAVVAVLLPDVAFAAGPEPAEVALNPEVRPVEHLAVWAVIELHFLCVMVLSGLALLTVLFDGAGAVLGRRLRIGYGLWRDLFSWLPVMFSLLSLVALAVAGLFPEAARDWMDRFAQTFSIHVYFGVLGLSSGYGVLTCRPADPERPRSESEERLADGAAAFVVLALLGGVWRLVGDGLSNAEGADLFGILALGLPLLLLVRLRLQRRADASRLTFEVISGLAFMAMLGIVDTWRGVAATHEEIADVFALLAMRRPFFHAMASVALVSLLELCWVQVGDSAGSALGRELKRAGGDSRWFLLIGLLAVTLLPFVGYLSSVEAARRSSLLVFQGGLAGLTLLLLSHAVWARLEAGGATGTVRTGLFAGVFIVGLIVLVSPGAAALRINEEIALGGQANHPLLARLGGATLKHLAFGMLALTGVAAALAMLRREVRAEPLTEAERPRLEAALWIVGLASILLALSGFGVARGYAAVGSIWDLTRVALLETDTESAEARVEAGRRALAEALGEPFAGDVDPAVERERAIARRALAPAAVSAHVDALRELERVQSDRRALREVHELSVADRDKLIGPTILLWLFVLVVPVAVRRMVDGDAAGARSLVIGFASAVSLWLFVLALLSEDATPGLNSRISGAQHVLLVSVILQLVLSEALLLVFSPRLDLRREEWPERRAVEIMAAVAFVLLLVLGGWARSQFGDGGMIASVSGHPLLSVLTSHDGVGLAAAVKSSFVLAGALFAFLWLSRFFVRVQEEEVPPEATSSGELATALPMILLGGIWAAYLVQESSWLWILGAATFVAVVGRTGRGVNAAPGVALALLFLVLGVEGSKLESVRRAMLLKPRVERRRAELDEGLIRPGGSGASGAGAAQAAGQGAAQGRGHGAAGSNGR